MSVVNEYEFTKDPDVNLLISAAGEAAMEVRVFTARSTKNWL